MSEDSAEREAADGSDAGDRTGRGRNGRENAQMEPRVAALRPCPLHVCHAVRTANGRVSKKS